MNNVRYETPVPGLQPGPGIELAAEPASPKTANGAGAAKRRLLWLFAGVLAICGAAAGAYWYFGPQVAVFLTTALSGALFGVNTVTYETPVAGTTAPTATQARPHQQLSAVITGDGAATTFTVTHNWGIAAADLTAGWPGVEYEYLLAAGYTAAALITSKSANAVVFSNTAFTGAGLRVRIFRPWSPTK
jgi:hypothetical protein